MSKMLVCVLALAVAFAFVGCDKPRKAEPKEGEGGGGAVAFGVGSCTDEDPAKAATTAVTEAIKDLGVPVKGLIFYEYFPKGGEGDDKEAPVAEMTPSVMRLAPVTVLSGRTSR